jgi:hypothetical protein
MPRVRRKRDCLAPSNPSVVARIDDEFFGHSFDGTTIPGNRSGELWIFLPRPTAGQSAFSPNSLHRIAIRDSGDGYRSMG